MDRKNLKGPVFLSASLPAHPSEAPHKDRKYWDARELLNLREAIGELAAVVLPVGPLVLGGHPAVNPLILGIADRLDHDGSRGRREKMTLHHERILVYQSRHFATERPPEIAAFPRVEWTNAVTAAGRILPLEAGGLESNRDMSLRYMRCCMVGRDGPSWVKDAFPQALDLAQKRRDSFRTDTFHAAVFLGGMDGVEQEFAIFRAFHPQTPVFLLPTTGSAARFLYDEQKAIYPQDMAKDLENSTVYGAIFARLLWSYPEWIPKSPQFLDSIPGFGEPVRHA